MLQGKTALVTGSTSGIGLGIACALARSGANVVLNGFGDAAAARAQVQAAGARTHAGAGVQVEHHGAMLARASEIEDLAAFSLQRFGRIDILVNNAGIQHVARLENFAPERWDAVIAINLSSAFHTTRLERLMAGGASSTSPPRTGWSPRQKNPLTSPPSTASSA